MIERPASAGASVAPAGAEHDEVAQATPAAVVSAPPEAGRTPAVWAGIGPDPALAPPAPPRLAERPGTRLGHTSPRSGARGTQRATTKVEGMTYRVVFACCFGATDTPTK